MRTGYSILFILVCVNVEISDLDRFIFDPFVHCVFHKEPAVR